MHVCKTLIHNIIKSSLPSLVLMVVCWWKNLLLSLDTKFVCTICSHNVDQRTTVQADLFPFTPSHSLPLHPASFMHTGTWKMPLVGVLG